MNADLNAFLEHARSKGMDHATIRMLLLSAGWKEKDVAKGLAAHALELPVPAPPDAGGARDAFLHLTAFAALYASVIAGVSLLFDYVHRWFPDPAFEAAARSTAQSLQGVRWSLAVLLVAFPVYLLTSRFLLKEIRAQAEKSWSGVRRWLTYLTLFVASLALGSDFVTLVFYFLEGGLTARFLLKVGIVALVAGMVFLYYVRSVRMPAATLARSRMHLGFAGAASVLAAGTLVWGLVLAGSPAAERLRRLDERRIEDLQAIESSVERICLGREGKGEGEREMKRALPATLQEIAAAAPGRRPSVDDPASGREYEYTLTGESTYRLCATFDQERDVAYDARWNHGAGRACFDLDVLDPR
jgi:hypothetical protein